MAVSDWMRAIPDQIAPFVPGDWSSLGTDGFGLSDTRAALRRHFKVDAPSIVLRVLEQLVARKELHSSVRSRAIETYRPDIGRAVPTSNRCCSARLAAALAVDHPPQIDQRYRREHRGHHPGCSQT